MKRGIALVLITSVLLLSFFSFVSAAFSIQVTGKVSEETTLYPCVRGYDSQGVGYVQAYDYVNQIGTYQRDNCYINNGQTFVASCSGTGCTQRLHFCLDLNNDGVFDHYNYTLRNCINCAYGVCNTSEFNETSISPVCEDTDNGKDYYVKGEVRYGTSPDPLKRTVVKDFCSSTVQVQEAYCLTDSSGNTNFGWSGSTCPYGCSDGACVFNLEGVIPCDPENNNAELCGNFCYMDPKPCDIANGAGFQSGYCSNGVWKYYVCSPQTCSKGYVISGGSCVPESSVTNNLCKDTDLGIQIYSRGTITATNLATGILENFTDSCYDLTISNNQNVGLTSSCEGAKCSMYEYYCQVINGRLVSGLTLTSCPYGCNNGACNAIGTSWKCVDTDGTEYYTSGKAYYSTDIEHGLNDYCLDGHYLVESYCNLGALAAKTTYCTNGCSNGACLSSSGEEFCEDSDGGIDLYTKGTVTDSNGYQTNNVVLTHDDFCWDNSSGTYVNEFYCSNQYQDSKLYPCPNGCYDGACVEKNTCGSQVTEDITQSGNYLVNKNTLINANQITAYIREISWALQGDTEPKVSINGNNAQACSLHAGEECIFYYGAVTHPLSKNLKIKVNSINTNEEYPEQSTACITVAEINEPISYTEIYYPAPFLASGVLDVAIIYGTQPDVSNLEIVQAANIQADLQERLGYPTGELLVKDSEMSLVLDKNLIVIGTPCSNSAILHYLRLSDCSLVTTNLGLAPGKAALKPVTGEDGKLVFLVVGYSPEELAKMVLYLTTKEIMTSRSYVLTVLEANQTVYIGDNCTDTDGGINYYVKGTATYDSSGDSLTLTEKCSSDGISVQELYCKEDGIYPQNYVCPNGCYDGACIKSQTQNQTQEQDRINCESGCIMEDKCYPFGYRKLRQYCYENSTFIPQSINEAYCENNFECRSNLCLDDQCINQGLLKKFMNWLKNSFGKGR